MQVKTLKVLYADDGKIITDGENYWESFVRLAEDADESKFYEITKEEYEAMTAANENTAVESDV